MTLPLPWDFRSEGVDKDKLQDVFDAFALQFPVGAANMVGAVQGTTLPTAPVNGQDYYYVADSTNGVVWHLKYRSASGSSYKWEFVGGPPLWSADTTSRSTSSSTFQTTGTPSVTLPLGGDYEIVYGAEYMQNAFAGTNTIEIGLHVNGSLVSTVGQNGLNNGGTAPASYTYRHNGASATHAVNPRYRSASSQSGSFSKIFVSVRPVRVG